MISRNNSTIIWRASLNSPRDTSAFTSLPDLLNFGLVDFPSPDPSPPMEASTSTSELPPTKVAMSSKWAPRWAPDVAKRPLTSTGKPFFLTGWAPASTDRNPVDASSGSNLAVAPVCSGRASGVYDSFAVATIFPSLLGLPCFTCSEDLSGILVTSPAVGDPTRPRASIPAPSASMLKDSTIFLSCGILS